MVRVNIDRDLGTKIAHEFGPQITRREAVKVLAKAKGIADSAAVGRNPGHSVAGSITMGLAEHGIDTLVYMNVRGRDGSNVAMHHEVGAYNERAHKRVEGHHVMQLAAMSAGL